MEGDEDVSAFGSDGGAVSMLGSSNTVRALKGAMGFRRMLSSSKALAFGEDFTTDPVSRMLGICLLIFSGGQLRVDLQLVAQVRRSSALEMLR